MTRVAARPVTSSVRVGDIETEPTGRLGLPGRMAEGNEDRVYTVLLVILMGLIGIPVILWPTAVPSALLFPVAVMSGLILSGRRLLWVYGAISVVFLLWIPNSDLRPSRSIMAILAMLSVMALMYVSARWRSLIGTRGFGGDRMFAELRDRIASVGTVIVVPPPTCAWFDPS